LGEKSFSVQEKISIGEEALHDREQNQNNATEKARMETCQSPMNLAWKEK
jgi:hypothetical protein